MKLTVFLRKLHTARKGAAVEMAIMLLVVTFALSTLVLTTSLLQHTKDVKARKEMERSITLEKISENFCAAVVEGESHLWVTYYPDYDITVDGLSLTAADPESGEVLLTVKLIEQDGQYTVSQWHKG